MRFGLRRAFVLAATAIATISLVASLAVIRGGVQPSGNQNVQVLNGSLFVSDAGQSHGGFEYTATYNVTVSILGESGIMKVNLSIGLGDVLTKHDYSVTSFQISSSQVAMRIDGRPVVLPWISNDLVWGHAYDNHYIASWGSNAPAEEKIGTISPIAFQGIPDTYYLELRLSPD